MERNVLQHSRLGHTRMPTARSVSLCQRLLVQQLRQDTRNAHVKLPAHSCLAHAHLFHRMLSLSTASGSPCSRCEKEPTDGGRAVVLNASLLQPGNGVVGCGVGGGTGGHQMSLSSRNENAAAAGYSRGAQCPRRVAYPRPPCPCLGPCVAAVLVVLLQEPAVRRNALNASRRRLHAEGAYLRTVRARRRCVGPRILPLPPAPTGMHPRR